MLRYDKFINIFIFYRPFNHTIVQRLILIQFVITILTCVYVKAGNYQNEWVLRINGGADVASLLAKRFDYTYLGPVNIVYYINHIKYINKGIYRSWKND